VEHEPEEFISLTSFRKMTEIYAKAIVELANA
jgi:acetylornithine deacetylase/succinyl-diaminopimelate desuccinylase-like protein